MNGTQFCRRADSGQMPSNWTVVGSDMKGDIFWRNTTTGEFAMWVMNGTTIAQSVSFGLQPLNWTGRWHRRFRRQRVRRHPLA